MDQVTSIVSDESKQRDLVLEDEEEDFLDDGKTPTSVCWVSRKVQFDFLPLPTEKIVYVLR